MTLFLMSTPVSTRVSTTDQVFEALRDAIISVRLPPNTKVSESDIAKQLGVSRQPVRDAFCRLSFIGLLTIRPQRATLISPISLGAVRDAIFTRTALETACLQTAIARDAEDLSNALQSRLTSQKHSSKASEFYAADEAFHETICQMAGHAHVWSVIKEHKAHLDRLRYLSLSLTPQDVVIAEHAAIVDAVAANDADAAVCAMRDHIGGVCRNINALRDRYPTYFDEASDL